ncbi:MAG: hypothetical protein J6T10_11330 [Methanobrevibacter sp.]|nr:hypothetical protein [Methanobrevibacter sp.]
MALQSAFTLTPNEIYETLANMIISQEVFADNIGKNQTLVDKARVDGGLFGDTKLYYATDVLKSHDWLNDSEAANLLALDRPADPEVQAIKLDVFRQIRLTLDNYMTKRAWANEGAFASFNSIMLGWMRETKRVYDGTLYNVFIGTTQSSVGKQIKSIDLGTGSGHPLYNLSGVEKEQMEAMLIAQGLADLLVEMGDYSRDFNDYANLRSYADEAIQVVWNSKFVNKIRKIDIPTIFHKEGLVDKFEQDVMPARYFGVVITADNVSDYSAASPTAGKPIDSDDDTYVPGVGHANGCIRACVEKDVTVSAVAYHVFPGDEIPAGATIKAGGNFELGEVYIEQADVICKVLVKLPPFMSAFEVGTTFFNPRSLTENHYLTFGHNSLAYLKNYPFITVKKA